MSVSISTSMPDLSCAMVKSRPKRALSDFDSEYLSTVDSKAKDESGDCSTILSASSMIFAFLPHEQSIVSSNAISNVKHSLVLFIAIKDAVEKSIINCSCFHNYNALIDSIGDSVPL